MKRILCAGPESNGTKMLAAALRKAGADTVHHSPNYWLADGYAPHRATHFDAVVIIVRSGYTSRKSMVDNSHATNEHTARVMHARGLQTILNNLQAFYNTHIVTLEALIHEPDALRLLLRDLGLDESAACDPVQDSNAKWYGGGVFRDQRELHERH